MRLAGGGVPTVAAGYTIALRAPGAGHREGYIYFTGFARFPDGSLIALGAVDQPEQATRSGVPGHQGRIMIARSEDGGAAWEVLETGLNLKRRVLGGALFVDRGALYLFASPREGDGVLLVARSDDRGGTWSDFSEVLRVRARSAAEPGRPGDSAVLDDDPGSAREERWFAYCQNAMVCRDGVLYLAVSERCRDMALVTARVGRGLMSPDAWAISPTVPLTVPHELDPGLFPGPSMGTLEGNVIEIGGRRRVIARQVVDRYGTSNVAAVFDVREENGRAALSFSQFFPVPGAHGKFDIVYDPAGRLYWMAANLESNSQNLVTHPSGCHLGRDRRFLTLWYALDALNWFPAGCIARAEKNRQTFNYPCLAIDGDDLAVLCRTTRDADNYTSHDADLVTFHRVRDFRLLAMNIFPVP